MRTTKLILSAILFTACAVPCWANEPTDSLTNEQLVEQASARFYEGLNAMFTGDATPMKEVWSHRDDVTYMGPAGGIQVGWDQVGSTWESQAALKLGGEVQPDDVHVTINGDLAIVQCREVGTNQDAEGNPQTVSIRATNVFRKENGEWKMIGHHTDLLPFLNQETQNSTSENSATDD
jgi:ketosteroid isomerase-like protein